MRISFTLLFLMATVFANAQSIAIEDGYYRLDKGDDENYWWTLHFEGGEIEFYEKDKLIVDFGTLEKKTESISDTLVIYEFVNRKAPEWHLQIVSIKLVDGDNYTVNVEFSVDEYDEFLKEKQMIPKGYSSGYFRGPMKREEALEKL